METKLNSVEDRTETGSWFKPKKGNVLPGKKMSVKRMMFGYLVRSLEDPFILKSIKRRLYLTSPMGKLSSLHLFDETQPQFSSLGAKMFLNHVSDLKLNFVFKAPETQVHKNSESISEKCRGIELKSLSSSSSNKSTKPRLKEGGKPFESGKIFN
uniref:Uncharacterized protein n=1 Tax=Salix viminalis TaxID=40686 RepID=A0A6N2MVN3_SALVM